MKKFLLAGAILWAVCADAGEPAKPLPKLASWVHVVGCLGRNDVILVFSDGQIADIRIDQIPDQARVELKDFIGDVRGLDIVESCGVQS